MIYLDVHTHSKQQEEGVFKIANLMPQHYNPYEDDTPIPFSMGLHPWDIDDKAEEITDLEAKFVKHPKCIAVGEIGLDKIKGPDLETQKQYFIKQINIARAHDVAILVHCVKAFNEVIEIIKNYPKNLFVMHGFTGSIETARLLVRSGSYLSFGEAIIKNPKVAELFKRVPLHKILLETDESEYSIKDIYKAACDIKQISLDELHESLFANFRYIFPYTFQQ